MHAYSDPSRASEKYFLPDVEVFRISRGDDIRDDEGNKLRCGWYWRTCYPGCLPDSDPFGPFPSAAAAVRAAQDIC